MNFTLSTAIVIQAYDVSLRASKKREQELKEELAAAQHAAKEKDNQCYNLENKLYDMYKELVVAKDDYEQAQKLLEQKGKRHTAAFLPIAIYL